MMRFVRDLRLIPIALIASACLLALKTADLVLESPYFFAANRDDGDTTDLSGAIVSRASPDSWAGQMFNFPNGKGAAPSAAPNSVQSLPQIAPRRTASRGNAARDNLDITGSVPEPPQGQAMPADSKPDAKPDSKPGSNSAAKPDAGAAVDAKAAPGKDANPPPIVPPSSTIIPSQKPVPTGAERAILERLQQRREELDTRSRELEMRENLIQDAEKRMDTRINELKDVETRIKTETQQKSEVEDARLKGLITMYQNMKPRDAAKIFNGLDDTVLVEVASKINPRAMAEIMAQMQPEVAQRLTVELASQAQPAAPQAGASSADLPKIEGQAIAR
jgi:flagellar motility protein MotE (MotC chaperone)